MLSLIASHPPPLALRPCKVPYVIVRPGHLVDGEATGKYHVSHNHKGFYHIAMKITKADVAAFILKAASTGEHDNTAVQLFS